MARKRIYIAEDFPMQIELLRAIFDGDDRFETTIFTDGLELYLKLQEDPPDALILDIILPTLSGLAVTRLLKFNDKFNSIPIMVTSSITDVNIKERVSKAGADSFLPKPFQPQQLIGGLMGLLD